MRIVCGLLLSVAGVAVLSLGGEAQPGPSTRASVAILAFIGAGVTLGAFSLHNWAITRMPADTASAHINLVPVVAVVYGFAFLDETMGPLQIAAACVVLCSLLMTQKS